MEVVQWLLAVCLCVCVGHGRNAKDKCMFLLYLHAISVSSGKGSGDASHCLHMEFSMKVRVWGLGGRGWGGEDVEMRDTSLSLIG